MKFEVELKDFWLEEEEITTELKKFIIKEVVTQISKSIENHVRTEISEKVEGFMREALARIISETLKECIDTGRIIRDQKEILITTHIKNVFQNSQGWNNPNEYIAQLAKKFGDVTKASYDAAFANRIVAALNEQGMLKDEVVKLLIK